MKVALIYRVDFDDPKTLGVQKKQIDQQNAFIELGYDCDAFYHRKGNLVKRTGDTEDIISSIPYKPSSFKFKDFFKALGKALSSEQYDQFYIRYPIASAAFLNFLKEQKANTTIEVPTYPYANEWKGIQRLYIPIATYYQNQLKKYCQNIVHFGNEKQLFGIPTICIANGINPERYSLIENNKVDQLHMIAVGNFNYWHGLDRLIKGMHSLKDKSVKLKVVGSGMIIPKLKTQVDELNLQSQVQFFPATNGKELDQLFDQSNLGVGTLAIHRKGVKINSSLKHREYTSRGLPFFYAGRDLDFEDCAFAMELKEVEKEVDCKALKNWHSALTASKNDIRNYAISQLSWKVKLKEVIARW